MFVYVVIHKRTRAVVAVIQADPCHDKYAVLEAWFAGYRSMTSLPVVVTDFELDAALVREVRPENARHDTAKTA